MSAKVLCPILCKIDQKKALQKWCLLFFRFHNIVKSSANKHFIFLFDRWRFCHCSSVMTFSFLRKQINVKLSIIKAFAGKKYRKDSRKEYSWILSTWNYFWDSFCIKVARWKYVGIYKMMQNYLHICLRRIHNTYFDLFQTFLLSTFWLNISCCQGKKSQPYWTIKSDIEDLFFKLLFLLWTEAISFRDSKVEIFTSTLFLIMRETSVFHP